MELPDVPDPALVEVRVLIPLWIGPQLFKVGDTSRLQQRDAEALRASGHFEIIV